MRSKEKYSKIIFPILRRYIFSYKRIAKTNGSIQSFLVHAMEKRRKRTQQDDIRLEPYVSKGVYTESGAIRPMPKRYPLGIIKVLLVSIPFLYLGSLASKYAAMGLEKMDVFIYTDDDDDDDD
ncbi:unnamed protein product [Adineta steineri]|uniref:Essential MCU regulator, mitochondrial n=1 Tax=Adineta steineri TaxID=433720 RepID=A0A814W2Y3_9BILA|nr:unnamed protein product [Adineta steineri]CAF1198552.1 unnamed protein product [Adineta steineri]